MDQLKWEYDSIFSQPDGNTIEQQMITVKRKGPSHLEVTVVTRRFYGNDYQDSVETKVYKW